MHGARQGYAKALLDRVGVVPRRLEPSAELFPDSVERKVFRPGRRFGGAGYWPRRRKTLSKPLPIPFEIQAIATARLTR